MFYFASTSDRTRAEHVTTDLLLSKAPNVDLSCYSGVVTKTVLFCRLVLKKSLCVKKAQQRRKIYKSHMFMSISSLNEVPSAQNKVSVSGFAEISTLGPAAV